MRKFVAIFVPIIATFLLYGCNINNTHTNEYEEEESISEYEYTRLGNLLIKFPDNWIKEDLGSNQYKLDHFTNLSISKDDLNNLSLNDYVNKILDNENVDYTICNEDQQHVYTTPNSYKCISIQHTILDSDEQIKFYKHCVFEYAGTAYIISLISTTNFGISDNDEDYMEAINSVEFR